MSKFLNILAGLCIATAVYLFLYALMSSAVWDYGRFLRIVIKF